MKRFLFCQISITVFIACQIANKVVLAEFKKFHGQSNQVSSNFLRKVTKHTKKYCRSLEKNDFEGKNCNSKRYKEILTADEVQKNLNFESFDIPKQVRIINNINVSEIPSNLLELFSDSKDFPKAYVKNRGKRAVFGYDSQYFLSSKKYGLIYPFSTVVKISTGCTGVQLSPIHILTAAHCIHNGKKYLKGVKKLRVGRYVKKRKKKRKTAFKRLYSKSKKKKGRISRSQVTLPAHKLKFKWRRAKKTFLPQAWVTSGNKKRKNAQKNLKYDYAMIQLKKPLKGGYMKLGIAPSRENFPRNRRIHFTTFNSENRDQLVYRYCVVEDQSSDLLFHRCDATYGSSGAGIYMKIQNPNTGEWDRKVVGVFSGLQRVKTSDDHIKNYNVGVMVTPLKFAQICYWKTGNYTECRNG